MVEYICNEYYPDIYCRSGEKQVVSKYIGAKIHMVGYICGGILSIVINIIKIYVASRYKLSCVCVLCIVDAVTQCDALHLSPKRELSRK